MDNQTSEKNYIHFLTFFVPSIFPPNFLSLTFSGNQTKPRGMKRLREIKVWLVKIEENFEFQIRLVP